MSRLKKILIIGVTLSIGTLKSFADIEGRGRIDSGSPSDSTAILLAIAGIVIGALFIPGLLGEKDKNNAVDKEMSQMGCAGIAAIIISIVLLLGMCSK